ncbi:hypothetical protein Sste5346_000710 [Sporothrix stenoceras]|uniref:Bladder cancer-related BC10-like protein n=1 Tax=Sporothrix stenoceras TaxID=5173 RepID=A0ABR3ZQP8_9PEZI
MFCLRSWLPLLFIPTNASPTFIALFFVCTYFLNRPCVYCSFLLLILFLTSCNWSDRCFFDFGSNWFEPRATVGAGAVGASGGCANCKNHTSHAAAAAASANNATHGTMSAIDDLHETVSMAVELMNSTVSTVAGSAVDQLAQTKSEWTGIGMEWLRSLLGRREWRIDCLDVCIRL